MQDTIYFLLLLFALGMLAPLFIRLWRFYDRKRVYGKIIKALADLYRDTDTFNIAKEANKQAKTEYLYGEIDTVTLLDLLAKINIKPQQTFYDLGSGAGKTLIAVKLRYPKLRVIGIELVSALHRLAQDKYAQYLKEQDKSLPSFDVVHLQSNYLEYNFNNADIIFVNATAISESWHLLLEKFKQLKPKTFIIITSKTLPTNLFIKHYEGMEQMSWGLTSTYIYEKK